MFDGGDNGGGSDGGGNWGNGGVGDPGGGSDSGGDEDKAGVLNNYTTFLPGVFLGAISDFQYEHQKTTKKVKIN